MIVLVLLDIDIISFDLVLIYIIAATTLLFLVMMMKSCIPIYHPQNELYGIAVMCIVFLIKFLYFWFIQKIKKIGSFYGQ